MKNERGPEYSRDGFLKPSYLNTNPVGAEQRWQAGRFGPYDSEVQNPSPHELASLDAENSAESFLQRSIGKRKDINRRTKTLKTSLESAFKLQDRIDASDDNHFTNEWTDHYGNTHKEIVGQGHVLRIILNAQRIIDSLLDDGHGARVSKVLSKYGMTVDEQVERRRKERSLFIPEASVIPQYVDKIDAGSKEVQLKLGEFAYLNEEERRRIKREQQKAILDPLKPFRTLVSSMESIEAVAMNDPLYSLREASDVANGMYDAFGNPRAVRFEDKKNTRFDVF